MKSVADVELFPEVGEAEYLDTKAKEELAFLRGAGSTKAQSRCIHVKWNQNGTTVRKLSENGTTVSSRVFQTQNIFLLYQIGLTC